MSKILLSLFLALGTVAHAANLTDPAKVESAFLDAVIATPNDSLKYFFKADEVDFMKSSKILEMETLPPGADPNDLDDFGNPKAEAVPLFSYNVIQASYDGPKTAAREKESAAGVALFKGDAFAAGFYFQHTDGYKTKAPSSALAQQPWFEWNAAAKKYVFHPSGAQDRIISQMGDTKEPKVKLYRGSGEQDAADLQLFSFLKDAKNHQREILTDLSARAKNARYSVALKKAFSDMAALVKKGEVSSAQVQALALAFGQWQVSTERFTFTTPDRKAAMGWAKTRLIISEFDRAKLAELSQQKKVYAGIEYEYVEVALSSPEAIAYFLLNSTAEKVAKASAVGASGAAPAAPDGGGSDSAK